MRKLVYGFAILAAAASTAAVAGEIKQDKKAAVPMVKATVMSDAEMDKISAGTSVCGPGSPLVGAGECTAHYYATATAADPKWGVPAVRNALIPASDRIGTCVGLGRATAGGQPPPSCYP